MIVSLFKFALEPGRAPGTKKTKLPARLHRGSVVTSYNGPVL
jgi:hypothetical protein